MNFQNLSGKLFGRVDQVSMLVKSLADPGNYSADAQLKMFGLTKVPLLFLAQPRVLKLDRTGCEIRINLNFVTRNHVGSMYFGTQAIGADACIGMLAFFMAKEYPQATVTPIFKDFKANFIKRAESDLIFVCNAGEQVERMVKTVCQKINERVTEEVKAEARLVHTGEVVSEFTLGLSVKAKEKV